jgi:tRNA-dihydrouridine synthase B
MPVDLAYRVRFLYIVGMKIGNLTVTGSLFLAPLAGISSHPFRVLARRYGASMCYTEMISVDALIRLQERTLRLIDIRPGDHPVGIQLFGSIPEYMAGAVKIIDDFNPDLIDINLGCPVKKVTRKNGGAALLKDMKLAEELISAAVENSARPVTIKIRTGWTTDDEAYLEVGRMAEKLGVAAVTLHPRSRTEGYEKKSDWSKIARLKREISIPVIGNGDIKTPLDAAEMIRQTACDAVMIGRAAMKNPYIFRRVKTYLEKGEIIPDLSVRQKVELALEHTRLMMEQFGEKGAVLKMRKHLAWYSKGMRAGADLRRELKSVSCYDDISNLLNCHLADAGSRFK